MTPGREPAPRTLTVRYNRRRSIWCVALGYPLSVVGLCSGVAIGVALDFDTSLLTTMIIWPPAFAASLSLLFLKRGHVITYDTLARTMTGRDRWGFMRTYPREPGDRIEYSIYFGEIRSVRADGKDRRYLRASRWFDQDDWVTFVDVLLAGQAAQGPMRPPANSTTSEVAENVQGKRVKAST